EAQPGDDWRRRWRRRAHWCAGRRGQGRLDRQCRGRGGWYWCRVRHGQGRGRLRHRTSPDVPFDAVAHTQQELAVFLDLPGAAPAAPFFLTSHTTQAPWRRHPLPSHLAVRPITYPKWETCDNNEVFVCP